MRASPLALVPILALAAGCNLDAAIFVEPSVADPVVTVSDGILGLTVTGSFALRLHLGPRASGSSQVDLDAIALTGGGDHASIVSPLPVKTTDPLPVTVAVDQDATLPFTIDAGGKPLPFDDKAKLCDPAGLVLTGAIKDSLAGGTTTFSSAVFQPAGCK